MNYELIHIISNSFFANTGDQVLLWVKSGAFKVPVSKMIKNVITDDRVLGSNQLVPMILIGPGTGVAPMRAILQERKHNISNEKVSDSIISENRIKTLLFFGCRNRSNDFLYREEWEALSSGGIVNDKSHGDVPIDNEIIEIYEESSNILDPDVYGGVGSETVIVAFSRDQSHKVSF